MDDKNKKEISDQIGKSFFSSGERLNNLIDERAKKIVENYMKSSGFAERKLTDLPTDALQVVSRRFVTLNGATANRPRGSVLGQRYFDTDLGIPVFWNGSTFVNSAGVVV